MTTKTTPATETWYDVNGTGRGIRHAAIDALICGLRALCGVSL